MKAVVLTRYGPADALQVRDVPRPDPGPGQLRIAVHATTVTRGDTELRALDLPWLFRLPIRLWLGLWGPRKHTILGMEMAGIVDEVGEGVEGFEVGDAVLGTSDMGLGTYAQYVLVKAEGLVAAKPAALSFAEAASVPIGGLAALGYLTKGGIDTAKRVLVRGASGSIGSFAVQIAKHFGAHVTAVCPPQGVSRVRALNADEVLDYTVEDFDASDKTWDLMLDVVGRTPIARCLKVLTPGGRYVRGTVPGAFELLRALWTRLTSDKRVIMGDSGDTPERLRQLVEMIEGGAVRPLLDRTYALPEAAEAHRYVEQGHKQGNVVLTVASADPEPDDGS
ncbi:MAG: NAD(P)-dependent alcohol dehydrogenase [Myxococcota bacterium]